jgi:hypothetical protein
MSYGYERLSSMLATALIYLIATDDMLDVGGEENLSLGERFKLYVVENPFRFLVIVSAIVLTLLMVTLVSIALPLLSTKIEDPLLEVFDLCSVNGTYRVRTSFTVSSPCSSVQS